ncbi:MAG TPA: hypothetical protein VKT29_00090 [Terriglobales bacterium]|nr:hypothetical protein [Terriglobales bacterium]
MPRKPSPPPTVITRRQFAQTAAWASATAALTVVPAAASPILGNHGDNESPLDEAESEARWQAIVHRYGDRLSEEQKKRLRKILAYNEKLLTPIRNYPLNNGDSAATVLKFYEHEAARALRRSAKDQDHDNPKAKE